MAPETVSASGTRAPDSALSEIIATLRELMLGDESAPSRVAAAKILLERMAPKDDEEQRRREAEERAAAIAEARCLLAELTLAASCGLYESPPVAEDGARGADYTP